MLFYGLMIFLRRIKVSKHIFIDSTFHVPKLFYQFFICVYCDDIIKRKIPGIFVIINSKIEEGYDIIFQNIKELLDFGENKYIFEYKTITTDNEQTLINSINKYFPIVSGVACCYHYNNNGQWLSYTNNICRFDAFMALHLLIFKNYIISKKNLKVYFEINEIVKLVELVILNLLNDINSLSRYELWFKFIIKFFN